MNESEIADRLKQNIPSVTSDVPTDSTQPSQAPQDTGYTADIGDATDMYKLYDFYGIDSVYRGPENEQKIQFIYRWAADLAGSTDYLAVAKVLTHYQQGMPKGFSDQSLLDKMYSFVIIQSKIDRMKQEQDLLYAN